MANGLKLFFNQFTHKNRFAIQIKMSKIMRPFRHTVQMPSLHTALLQQNNNTCSDHNKVCRFIMLWYRLGKMFSRQHTFCSVYSMFTTCCDNSVYYITVKWHYIETECML